MKFPRPCVLPALAGALFVFPGFAPCAHAQSTTDEKVAAYEKAIQALQEQINQLKKEVQQVKEAQKAAPAAPKPTEPPKAPVKPRAEAFGFLQSQFENVNGDEKSRFFFRRARLGVRGTLDAGFNYEVLGSFEDAAAPLRNAFIEYRNLGHTKHTPYLRFGQFKTAYSLESLENAALTPFVERAIVVEQLAVNHERDMGIGFYTPANPDRPYAYNFSVMNGAGRNQFAATATKLFTGRFQLNTTAKHPFLGGSLAVGFATRQGSVKNLNRAAGQQQENEHYGIDLEYIRKGFRLRGEYLWARDGAANREGYYLLAGYHLRKPLEALFRYEGFSPDRTAASVHRTSLGLTYHFSPATAAYLNYEFIDGTAPSGQTSGLRFRLTTLFP